jgi:hypothetical protein
MNIVYLDEYDDRGRLSQTVEKNFSIGEFRNLLLDRDNVLGAHRQVREVDATQQYIPVTDGAASSFFNSRKPAADITLGLDSDRMLGFSSTRIDDTCD